MAAPTTEGSTPVAIRLPSLDADSPLYHEKKKLFDRRGLSSNFELLAMSSFDDALKLLDQIICTARVLHMDELEIYFVEDEDSGPFSARNELESLNTVLNAITSSVCTAGDAAMGFLQALENATRNMVKSLPFKDVDLVMVETSTVGPAESLLKWGENNGMQSKLKVAFFEGAGRGLVASEDIGIGEIALEIPESLIISEDILLESDMHNVVKNLDGVTSDTILLLWSMRERHNSSSKFKSYFEALPESFNTGLSFGIDGLAALDGTLLLEELMQAKQHLRQQYDELFPMLCKKYSEIFNEELYTWEHYLWACELWYSNGMKVVTSDGKLKTCLIPIAGLLNHSLCPHILHYGRVDPATKSLKFALSRPCKAGEQCYLSYGSFPGSHMVVFYGFLPKGDNPYDIIPLDFNIPSKDESSSSPATVEDSVASHMVRGTWFSQAGKSDTYGLPSKLLLNLQAVVKCNVAQSPEISDQELVEIKRQVLELLLSIFAPMLEGLGDLTDIVPDENASWDVKLALEFKDLHRRIISSVISSCTSSIKSLEL